MARHKLQILGTGCSKCERLTAVAKETAEELGLDFELEKVTDVMKFVDFGVMVTPALVVDGRLKVAGKVPTRDEMRKLLAPEEVAP